MSSENQHMAPIELLSKFFSGECSSEEKQQLEQWRTSSEENQKEYDAFAKAWDMVGNANTLPNIDIDKEWQYHTSKINPVKNNRHGQRFIKTILQIAAILVIVSGISFFAIKQKQQTTFKTALAEVEIVNLPDGSAVTLNASTKLSYTKDFNQETRRVKLKGEAFFEVNSDAARPFIVEANNALIKVIGTKFNVNSSSNEVRVYVSEGVVLVQNLNNPEVADTLRIGESAVYKNKEGKIDKNDAGNANEIAWKTKRIHLSNTPLPVVAQILESTYHVNIRLSESVKNCNITASFDNEELASVLKVLQSTLDLKVRQEKDELILYGKGCLHN